MKKLSGLLTVSLVAFMMAPAARADIASTAYVNNKDTAIRNDMEVKANKVTDTKNYTGDADSTEKYPSMAVANQMAKSAAAKNAAGKLDNKFENKKNQVMVTNATGAVTPTTVDTEGTGNAVTAVTVADGKYTVTRGTTFATKEQLDTVQTTANNTAAAVNDATTGLAATKAIADKNKTDIVSMDTAYKAADTAINDKIGTVATGKTVVQMIEDAKTSATYDDAAVKAEIAKKQDKLVASGEKANIVGSDGVSVSIGTDGKINVKGNQAAIDTALAGKQDNLSTKQMNAVNSGITADNVTTYDGYDARITTAQNQADKGVTDAAAAQATASKAVVANTAITAGTGTKITYDAKGLVTGSTSLAASDIPALTTGKITGLDTALAGKIPVPSATNDKGTLVLTYNTDTKVYAWESIGR